MLYLIEYWIFSDYHKAIAQRQQLDGQLSENTAVKKVCNNYNSMEHSSWEPASRSDLPTFMESESSLVFNKNSHKHLVCYRKEEHAVSE